MSTENPPPTDADRLMVLQAAGLPETWGDRLRGETVEELAADASSLAEALGVLPEILEPAATGDAYGGGQRGGGHVREASFTDQIRDLAWSRRGLRD